MNRQQKRQKPLTRQQEMWTMWNALHILATGNNDTILLPKLETWRPYTGFKPKFDKDDQVYKALKKCFKTTEKEVDIDMKRRVNAQ